MRTQDTRTKADKLQALASDPNTTDGERGAARNALARLKAKGQTPTQGAAPPYSQTISYSTREEMADFLRNVGNAARAARPEPAPRPPPPPPRGPTVRVSDFRSVNYADVRFHREDWQRGDHRTEDERPEYVSFRGADDRHFRRIQANLEDEPGTYGPEPGYASWEAAVGREMARLIREAEERREECAFREWGELEQEDAAADFLRRVSGGRW